jgi:hypothetical protein
MSSVVGEFCADIRGARRIAEKKVTKSVQRRLLFKPNIEASAHEELLTSELRGTRPSKSKQIVLTKVGFAHSDAKCCFPRGVVPLSLIVK